MSGADLGERLPPRRMSWQKAGNCSPALPSKKETDLCVATSSYTRLRAGEAPCLSKQNSPEEAEEKFNNREWLTAMDDLIHIVEEVTECHE